MEATVSEQRYGPTSGLVTGWIGTVGCAALIVWFVLGRPMDDWLRWVFATGAGEVLIWAFLLRPRVILRPTRLVLRNAFSSWELPLVGIETVAVGAITRVRTRAGTTYDGLAVGRPVRPGRVASTRAIGGGFAPQPNLGTGFVPRVGRPGDTAAVTPHAIATLMSDQIFAAVDYARQAGIPDGPALRVWAWPELAVAVGCVVGFVVTFL